MATITGVFTALGHGAADRIALHLGDEMTPEAEEALAPLVAARAARQPMAQILGERLFWGRAFEVTRDKKVVWKFNDFKTFGNGLATSHVLDIKAIR